ncbi:hypothetical protein NVP1029O_11 [Vibrio phage 1.029.O._10N.261.55.A7]|nr:hypothetical protein NVP1029O_11 [Vibrio phage 1.029.O._10N.261.55.A7]
MAVNPIPYYNQLIEDIKLVNPSCDLTCPDKEEIIKAIESYEPSLLSRTVNFESDQFRLGMLIGLSEAIRKERP